MPQHRTLYRLALVALLLGGPPAAVLAEPEEHEVRSKLEKLQGEIKRISAEISSDSARKNSLQQQLREAELELGRLQSAMAANERAIAASREELSTLQLQRTALEQARSFDADVVFISATAGLGLQHLRDMLQDWPQST